MPELHASLKSKHKFSLNWSYLSGITSGMSVIDLSSLALRNLHDAKQFVREYGFDIDKPATMERVREAHREAVDFVKATFLDPSQGELIPPEVDAPDTPLQLLIYASRRTGQSDPLRLWSCAVLKVMHGIFYIDSNLKLRHFNTIREQVFASLDEVIVRDGEQYYLTDGEVCLPLLHFEKKRNKGRSSILLKLLQKADYVAADIHDHLGVRLTLATRFECLLALRTLQHAHLLSITNVDPHRTRNTLLDLEAAKQVFARYRTMLEHSEDYPAELLQRMDEELAALATPQTRADNPHSGAGFNSLQVTIRKMIHLHADDLPDVRMVQHDPEAKTPLATGPDDDVGFFFEYEIQLMDRDSHDRSLSGPASHDAYKSRQVDTARTRVFGRELMNWVARQGSGTPAPTAEPTPSDVFTSQTGTDHAKA